MIPPHEEKSFEDFDDNDCQIYRIFLDKFFQKFGENSSQNLGMNFVSTFIGLKSFPKIYGKFW